VNCRIEKLLNIVLKENYPFRCKDGHIGSKLADASENERLRIIKEEYAKVIEIDEVSLLAGYYPTVSFAEFNKIDDSSAKAMLNEKYTPCNTNIYMVGGHHFDSDFEGVITNGFSGLLEQIESKRDIVTDEEQKKFLDELRYAAQAVIAWTQAYAEALRIAAEKETSKERSAELLQMADICSRVPRLPATNFREAIQSYYFTFILYPDGLGRLDQYLYPYYSADIEKGILTKQDALHLIEELFIKVFASNGKKEVRSANNHCVVGGYTPNGECGHNECTSLILKAVTELPTWRPQVSYRVTAKTTSEQLSEVVEMNYKRHDLIMFLNDDAIINGLLSVGIERADAINYSSSGCNETVLTGRSQMGALEGHVNLMHSLEKMMRDTEKLKSFNDFDEFYAAYEDYLSEDLDFIFRYSYDRDSVMALQPRILQSLLTTGCIDSATPIMRGGAKYNFCTWCLTGLVNLANSLSIIKQTVFDEKRFTLTELSRFLENNWKGYEGQRAYIINNCRYFGNDDDYVDLLINRIGVSVNTFAKKYTPYRGGKYLFGTLTGYELAHIHFGAGSGASLDGRYASEPFAASIDSFPGTNTNGITSYLKSASKIDEAVIQSSVVVNMKIDRAIADTEEKRQRLNEVLYTYFRLGGIQLQLNYLSADELIQAQQNPERYQSLRVRVTGFSGFFTSFDKGLQDEIIQRYLHTN